MQLLFTSAEPWRCVLGMSVVRGIAHIHRRVWQRSTRIADGARRYCNAAYESFTLCKGLPGCRRRLSDLERLSISLIVVEPRFPPALVSSSRRHMDVNWESAVEFVAGRNTISKQYHPNTCIAANCTSCLLHFYTQNPIYKISMHLHAYRVH